MHDFKKLIVWIKSIELATEIYQVTDKFPKSEIYGIVSQMRRSAVSISSNIAEGAGRSTNADFKVFLGYAYGSSYELETQVIISERLLFINQIKPQVLRNKIDRVQKMIYKLRESL